MIVELEYEGQTARGRGQDFEAAVITASRKLGYSIHHQEYHPNGPFVTVINVSGKVAKAFIVPTGRKVKK
jgi:hypothetical protein